MSRPSRALTTLPELAGWLTFGEAATELGVSIERVRQMATSEPRKLKTARQLGRRPIGIVREAEVMELAALRKSQAGEAGAV